MTTDRPCPCRECNPQEQWICGGYECGETVEGGRAEKLAHLTEAHPGLYALLWVRKAQPDARTPKVDERPAAV